MQYIDIIFDLIDGANFDDPNEFASKDLFAVSANEPFYDPVRDYEDEEEVYPINEDLIPLPSTTTIDYRSEVKQEVSDKEANLSDDELLFNGTFDTVGDTFDGSQLEVEDVSIADDQGLQDVDGVIRPDLLEDPVAPAIRKRQLGGTTFSSLCNLSFLNEIAVKLT